MSNRLDCEASNAERAVAEYEQWLIARLAGLLNIDAATVDPTCSLEELGIDSVTLNGLAQEMEDFLGVPVRTEMVLQHREIRALSKAMARLNGRRPSTAANQSSAVEMLDDGVGRHCRGASFFQRYRERMKHVDEMRAAKNYFYEAPVSDCDGAYIKIGSQRLLMLSSYSYLGLLGHPEIQTAIHEVVARLGAGSHGVRIVAGTSADHLALEASIAALLHADAAITFSSGFMTNVATISSLVGLGDTILADELIHASLVDGCRSSGAQLKFFRHNDIPDLRRLLMASEGKPCLVVVDGVYSMEGDIAPLPEIVGLCDEFDALLMVDEAHSIGVIGKSGRGVQEHFGLPENAIDIKMGTLSKALGSVGGFVAGRAELIDFLRHNARSYIFSGALAPPQVAAASTAIEILIREPERVAALQRNARHFVDACKDLGLQITQTGSAVVPLLCENSNQALAFTGACRERDVFVVPIVYPAVPMNAPRIRTCVMANHTEEQLDFAVSVFREAGQEAGLILPT